MNPTVLLVDENEKVRSLIKRALVNDGFQVVEAEQGLDGLTKAKSDHFDCFVIDYRMPIMDGITLIHNLRELEAYQHSLMVLLTTDQSREVMQRAAEEEIEHILTKPVDLAHLTMLIASCRENAVA